MSGYPPVFSKPANSLSIVDACINKNWLWVVSLFLLFSFQGTVLLFFFPNSARIFYQAGFFLSSTFFSTFSTWFFFFHRFRRWLFHSIRSLLFRQVLFQILFDFFWFLLSLRWALDHIISFYFICQHFFSCFFIFFYFPSFFFEILHHCFYDIDKKAWQNCHAFWCYFLGYCNCACAAANLAIGTRYGEQDT